MPGIWWPKAKVERSPYDVADRYNANQQLASMILLIDDIAQKEKDLFLLAAKSRDGVYSLEYRKCKILREHFLDPVRKKIECYNKFVIPFHVEDCTLSFIEEIGKVLGALLKNEELMQELNEQRNNHKFFGRIAAGVGALASTAAVPVALPAGVAGLVTTGFMGYRSGTFNNDCDSVQKLQALQVGLNELIEKINAPVVTISLSP